VAFSHLLRKIEIKNAINQNVNFTNIAFLFLLIGFIASWFNESRGLPAALMGYPEMGQRRTDF